MSPPGIGFEACLRRCTGPRLAGKIEGLNNEIIRLARLGFGIRISE